MLVLRPRGHSRCSCGNAASLRCKKRNGAARCWHRPPGGAAPFRGMERPGAVWAKVAEREFGPSSCCDAAQKSPKNQLIDTPIPRSYSRLTFTVVWLCRPSMGVFRDEGMPSRARRPAGEDNKGPGRHYRSRNAVSQKKGFPTRDAATQGRQARPAPSGGAAPVGPKPGVVEQWDFDIDLPHG